MCLEKQKGIFHSHNINHIKILDLAFESAIKMEQLKESLKYGILLIDGYRYIILLSIIQTQIIKKQIILQILYEIKKKKKIIKINCY